MRLYESVFIARQDISSQQVESMADEFAGIITNAGGKIHKREYWGLRSLAYRIKKNRKGHYTLMNIDAPADAVHELERQMRINEDVLRYITLRIDEFEEGPSAMMRSRDRDDRPRRGRDDRGDRGPHRDDPPKEPAAEDELAEAPTEPEDQNEGDNA